MLKNTVLALPILALAMAASAQNQELPKTSEPPKFYRLDFVVKEVEGAKILNARSYSLTVATDGSSASIRTGNKVPLQQAGGSGFQYFDLGVNIDCRSVRELQRDLTLVVAADVSSFGSEPKPVAPGVQPIIRQNRWSAPVIVPLRKPTLIFSSDDTASKRQMQLELTATPIT